MEQSRSKDREEAISDVTLVKVSFDQYSSVRQIDNY
jgi:hypothetical protein